MAVAAPETTSLPGEFAEPRVGRAISPMMTGAAQ